MLNKVALSVVLLIGSIFFTSNERALAQPTLKEKNRIKNFGKSLEKYNKKGNGDSKNKEKKSEAANEETIRVETNLVVSDVLVLNQKGNAILGLKKSDFVITEDGAAQEVELFSFGENATVPRSIVLIIDYSGSMIPYIKTSVEAAKILADKLSPQDRMAIVTADVKLLVDFTNDKALLKENLDSLLKKASPMQRGRTSQYTALLAALNELFDEEDIRPIVIFQSDGDELSLLKPMWKSRWSHLFIEREFSFSDVKSTVEKSRATIYSIIPGLRFLGLSKEEQLARAEITIENMSRKQFNENDKKFITDFAKKHSIIEREERIATQSAMFEVADLSGGHTDYLEKPEDAEIVYSTILKVIDNRYVIGYYSTNQEQDGKQRKIKIEVRGHPEYIILGRKTYFAAQKE